MSGKIMAMFTVVLMALVVNGIAKEPEKGAAEHFRNAIIQEQWQQAMQAVRKPLAKPRVRQQWLQHRFRPRAAASIRKRPTAPPRGVWQVAQ